MSTLNQYYQPAEWETHKATWTAWPAAEDLWQKELVPAQEQFSEMVASIAQTERVNVLVLDEKTRKDAETALKNPNVHFYQIPYGDIWVRDTAPIFLESRQDNTQKLLACFEFNGWGNKYVLPFDKEVNKAIARLTKIPCQNIPLVFEGGSVDVNGSGLALTTRECLLNNNRNPNHSEEQITDIIKNVLGVEKLIWLNCGLKNDHTDGHIDNIARFVSKDILLCMKASGANDPNSVTYEEIYKDLIEAKDDNQEAFHVYQVPSPGLVKDNVGNIIPASFMNFYIGNDVVVVPTYGTPYDEDAVDMIASYFPCRRTVGVRANALISGGGSFHCITQQEPL